jgi:hypothetical protein
MTGGSGGDGGDGTSVTSTASEGGEGGEPGALNLVSDGDIDIQGTITLTLGNGGNGGNATSTVGAAGVAATATGGKGSNLKPRNFTKPITIESKRGTLTVFGTINVKFGNAGAGGTATANGGAGAPGNPGQKGGDAIANGGHGGDVEPWSLATSGNTIVLGVVNVTGGAGGAGGESIRNPGKGGDGNVPGANGGPGGNASGKGGNGGKGQPSPFVAGTQVAAAASLSAPGGAAGNSTSMGGRGGDGALLCPGTGGAGGKGGDASGGGGDRGIGVTAGALAVVTFNAFGNGGNGKAGLGPLGPGGMNTTTAGSGGGVVPAPGTSFQPGLPGPSCPSFAIALLMSYVHVGPGVSYACTRITGMAETFVRGSENITLESIPGATWTVQWSGPGTVGSTQGSGTLDAQSQALHRQLINQFGTYTANVSVTSNGITKQASGTVSVGGAQGTCTPP